MPSRERAAVIRFDDSLHPRWDEDDVEDALTTQLETILDAFHVSVVGIEEGLVSLALAPTEETLASMKDGEQAFEELDVNGILRLREEDAVPVSATISLDANSQIEMTFENFSLLVREEIPEDTFLYTPPEGAQVVDMGPLMRAGM